MRGILKLEEASCVSVHDAHGISNISGVAVFSAGSSIRLVRRMVLSQVICFCKVTFVFFLIMVGIKHRQILQNGFVSLSLLLLYSNLVC